MNRLKKFWIVFFSFLPISAGMAGPFLIGLGLGAVGIVGFSIYRSAAPVNISDAFDFFSSCWTCQMFADIMASLSRFLPGIYGALSSVVLPFSVILTLVWFAWEFASDYLNLKIPDPWSMTTKMGTHIVKLILVCGLLAAPLPRLITEIAIQPIFNIAFSLNHSIAHDETFDSCIVATALEDQLTATPAAAQYGAFPPRMRHNMTCELAGIHRITGMGMTVGWTMTQMAFNSEYMHQILWGVPIFPNVPVFFFGLLILAVFFAALVPIPMYFLEIFIKLTLDLIMLPLMLLSWLFSGWKISLQGAGKTIRGIIDSIIDGALGLAMTGIFLSFALMFLDAMFSDWKGINMLEKAISEGGTKGAEILMDALMLRNDSLITIALFGLFVAMTMTSIPALSKTLFNVTISDDFYKTAKSNADTLWKGVKNFLKKA